MQFYFIEVTYSQNPIIWKTEGDKNYARGVQVYDLSKSEGVDIASLDVTKLSVIDGIIIQNGKLVIPNVAEFVGRHKVNKIIYRMKSAKVSVNKDKIGRENSDTSPRSFALATSFLVKDQLSLVAPWLHHFLNQRKKLN